MNNGDPVTQLGVFGVLAIILLKEIIAFIRNGRAPRGNPDGDDSKKLDHILFYAKETYKIHKDADGLLATYVKRIIDSISNVNQSVAKLIDHIGKPGRGSL